MICYGYTVTNGIVKNRRPENSGTGTEMEPKWNQNRNHKNPRRGRNSDVPKIQYFDPLSCISSDRNKNQEPTGMSGDGTRLRLFWPKVVCHPRCISLPKLNSARPDDGQRLIGQTSRAFKVRERRATERRPKSAPARGDQRKKRSCEFPSLARSLALSRGGILLLRKE